MRAPVDDTVAVHDADDAAGEVVVAVDVEAGHLGGLAADQRAAGLPAAFRQPFHDIHHDVRQEFAGREVVEKEERARALHEDVVDAVVDQVAADGVVLADRDGDLELGAHAVDAGDQYGVLIGRSARPARTCRRNCRHR